MADPALNPNDADNANADGAHEELDLESQIDALLTEVSETVEKISERLEPESAPDPEIDLEAGAAITDEGSTGTAAAGIPESEDPEAGSSEAEDSEAADPEAAPPEAEVAEAEVPAVEAPEAEEAAEPTAEDADPEPEGTSEPEAGIQEPESGEPESTEPEPAEEDQLAAVTAAAVQEELEAAVAESMADPAEAPPSEYTDAVEDELAALASTDEPDDDIEGEIVGEEPPASPAEAPPLVATPGDDADATPAVAGTPTAEYTDAEALDDELAALASADDLDGEFEGDDPPEPATPAAPAAEEPAAEPAESDAASDSEPAEAPAAESAPEPEPVADDDDHLWGWLPPKPDWPEVFGKSRPLVIAYRYAAWIVPPFLLFVWGIVRAHGTRAAIAAEPKVRHAVAVAAAPLSKQDERTRSMIGYLSVSTLFWSACIWAWILVGRSPVVPDATTPPTALEGEQTTAIASD